MGTRPSSPARERPSSPIDLPLVIIPSTPPSPASPLSLKDAEVEEGQEIIELTADTFDAFLTAEGPNSLVMVDFYTVSPQKPTA